METSLSDNVHLDGGVTTRVVDRAGVDLGDRHFDELEIQSQKEKEEKFRKKEPSTNTTKGGRQVVAGSGLAGGGMRFTDGPK